MMQRFLFFIALFVVSVAAAQETRTVNTRISDALALLPAKDTETANVAYAELMSLDEEGLGKVFDGIRPSGDASGVPYHYAVSLLAARSVKPDDRTRIEIALINALKRSKETEVKQYFISYLAIVGTNRSASALTAAMVSDQALADQASGALLSIAGTRTAADLQPTLQGTITVRATQKHLRIAELRELVRGEPTSSQALLIKELDRFDAGYRRDVLNIAATQAGTPTVRDAWVKEYRKSKGERQADIFSMLVRSNKDHRFTSSFIIPALQSQNPLVRVEAINALGASGDPKNAGALYSLLANDQQPVKERNKTKESFLRVADDAALEELTNKLSTATTKTKVSILDILSERRYRQAHREVLDLYSSPDSLLRRNALAALPYVVVATDIDILLTILPGLKNMEFHGMELTLIEIAGPETSPQILKAAQSQKVSLLGVLPYLGDPLSLNIVKSSFEQGQGKEKELAFEALTKWQNQDVIPTLQSIVKQADTKYKTRALIEYVRQVVNANWPADQKLLKLREIFPLAATPNERKLVLRQAGGIRTFLSFAFVSSWIDDPELGETAARATMRLALPTSEGQPGMTGAEVRTALGKVMELLSGPDSQYDRIDVQTYLDQLPYTQGFEPIFNGKDLTGWQGLVENPIARSKMTKEQLAAKQAVSDAKLSESWSVKDGMICFTGTGDNLCTKQSYGDFELIIDWKISKNGDSGIYLRGSPQVQIWDTSRVDVGAQVGSGGLYNNTANRNPLVVADNPIGDWNTLRITMIGERVTVYLNGILVVDKVVMENYWDRKIPIFPQGPIELQAHGTELAFRNVYVRELNRPYQLSAEEKQQGYELLFNSKDLSGWVGNKTDYVVDDQVIVINPTGRGKGNLYTEKEYGEFVFRFEFQLTPAGNNGLGIHAPLEGDAAYVGKEIQILDDRHVAYKDIQPWQVHGSVYGVIAAKRDALRPTGQWNEEEVEVHGDRIKVTVNGVVIVDGDMKKASAKGTLDGKEHPGLQRHSGHIGFLGHGSVVRFRNIRIRDLQIK